MHAKVTSKESNIHLLLTFIKTKMERMSSRHFFGRMPEAFMEPLPPALSLNRDRLVSHDSAPSNFLQQQSSTMWADTYDNDSGDANRASLTNGTLSSDSTLRPRRSAGEASIESSGLTALFKDDVFFEDSLHAQTSSTSTKAPYNTHNATQDEVKNGRDNWEIELELERFSKLDSYISGQPVDGGLWASSLSITEAEWRDRLDKSEAELYNESRVKDEQLREV